MRSTVTLHVCNMCIMLFYKGLVIEYGEGGYKTFSPSKKKGAGCKKFNPVLGGGGRHKMFLTCNFPILKPHLPIINDQDINFHIFFKQSAA